MRSEWSVIAALLVCMCSSGPEPIHFGEDQCSYCKMTIADPKFGGELVTEKGRVYKFDAIECLLHALPGYEGQTAVYAVPFDAPGSLVPVDTAVFVVSSSIRSPMGEGIAAFLHESSTPGFVHADQNARVLRWEQLKENSGPH